MTAKQFFKSTAFKCIAVLLSIMLVCGVLLTFCNALFYVTDKERTARAIAKVFPGEEVTTADYTEDALNEEHAETVNYEVTAAYSMTGEREGMYLLTVVGLNGYQSGTVTCWVLVNTTLDGEGNRQFDGIERVVVTGNEKQSFISKISDSAIQSVIDKQDSDGFTAYNTTGISTGATFSLGAIANAMNGARDYVNRVYCGAISDYADYEYNDYISDATTVTVDGTNVNYTIVTISNGPANAFTIEITVGSDGRISAYEIKVNGSNGTAPDGQTYFDKMSAIAKNLTGQNLASLEAMLDDGSLSTGATRSNTLCVQAALFATANYERALEDFGQGGAQQ